MRENTSPFIDDVKQNRKNRSIFNGVFWILFLGIVIVFSYWLGRSQAYATTDVPLVQARIVDTNPPKNDEKLVSFGLFWDVWDVVRQQYVDYDTLRAQDLIKGAINGMLSATGDPYTMFFDREELDSFNEGLTGTFEGIGAEIGIRDGALTIIAPLDESPAEKAGLRAGDIVVRIDEESTADMSVEEAVNIIRGDRGTQVKLVIYRDGADDTQDIVITRDRIVVKSISANMEKDSIGYIRIRRFGQDTPKDFFHAGQQLKSEGAKALIIDVRNNPGGYLESAIAMAGMMLPEGDVVVMSEGKDSQREMFHARGRNILGNLPTVILINEGSASASEIIAGALRDNREDVIIIGQQSFGKGSVQELVPVSDGAVKVTIAKWLTPNGDHINEIGIAPDEAVEMTEEDFLADRDPQKNRAVDRAIELTRNNK